MGYSDIVQTAWESYNKWLDTVEEGLPEHLKEEWEDVSVELKAYIYGATIEYVKK